MFHLTGQALWSPLPLLLHRQFNISENAASFVQKTLGRPDKITAVSPSGLSCELWDPYHDLSQWHSPDAPQEFKWNCFHLNHHKPSERSVVFGQNWYLTWISYTMIDCCIFGQNLLAVFPLPPLCRFCQVTLSHGPTISSVTKHQRRKIMGSGNNHITYRAMTRHTRSQYQVNF